MSDAPSSPKEWFMDFIAGSVSGAAGIVVGQPFDIVKTRMAASELHKGNLFKTLTQISRKEGFFALWKGLLPPMFGWGFINSIMFGSYANMNRYFCVKLGKQRWKDLPLRYIFYSGCVSGLVSDIINIPVELLKIQLMMNTDRGFTSMREMSRHILKQHGIRGLYKGALITIYRDVPSVGTYFMVYQWLKRKWGSGTLAVLNAGGIAGVVSWVNNYPFDVIKMRLQGLPYKPKPGWNKYKGMIDCTVKTYRAEGIKPFFRGFTACAIRAYPVNAVTFFGYELTMRLIRYASGEKKQDD